MSERPYARNYEERLGWIIGNAPTLEALDEGLGEWIDELRALRAGTIGGDPPNETEPPPFNPDPDLIYDRGSGKKPSADEVRNA